MGYRIGIQILSYNKPKYLIQTLESLMKVKGPKDKVIVFEQSDSPEIRQEGLAICKEYSDVQVILSTENLGQRGATNKIIQSGFYNDCEFVMLSDHDNVFHESLDLCVDKLNNDKSVWVATFYNSPEHDIEQKDGEWLRKTTARAGHMVLRQKDFMSMTPIDEQAGIANGCAWFAGLDWFLTHWSPNSPGMKRPNIIAAYPGGCSHIGRESCWQGTYDDEYTVDENLRFRRSTMDEILTFYKPRHAYQSGKYWYEVNPPKLVVESTSIDDSSVIKDLFKKNFNKQLSDSEFKLVQNFWKVHESKSGIIAFNYIWPNYGFKFLELSIRSILQYVTKYVIYVNRYSYVGKPCDESNIQFVKDVISKINSDKIEAIYNDDPNFDEFAKRDNISYYFMKCIKEYSEQSEYVMLVQSDEIYDDEYMNMVFDCCKTNVYDAVIFQPLCYMDTPMWRVDPPETLTRPTLVKNKINVDLKNKVERLDICFYHYSYVLTNDELKIKFDNWGHRNDVDINKFSQTFNDLKINKHLKDLHPIYGPVYKSVKFDESDLAKDNFKFWLRNNCETIVDVVEFINDNLLPINSNIAIYTWNEIGICNFDLKNNNATVISDNHDIYLDGIKYSSQKYVYGSILSGIQYLESESLNLFIYNIKNNDVNTVHHNIINIFTKLKNFGWCCCIYQRNTNIGNSLKEVIKNGIVLDNHLQRFMFNFNDVVFNIIESGEYDVCLFRVNLDYNFLPEITTDNVIFGPFVGEFGWELSKWAPMITKFKIDNPNRHVVVYAESSNFGLYPFVDKFYSISDTIPDVGRDGFSNSQVTDDFQEELIDEIVEQYPNRTLINPCDLNPILNIFNKNKLAFKYSADQTLVDEFIDMREKKIQICIASRHISNKARNWTISNWLRFYDLISKSNKYFGIIVGKSPTIVKNNNSLNNIICCEDLGTNEQLLDYIISAMISSTLTIGQQSSLPILSQLVGTPTLMFGHMKYRNMNFDNPFNVRKMFIESPKYDISPEDLYRQMDLFVNKITKGF